jgi:hypothetical protein
MMQSDALPAITQSDNLAQQLRLLGRVFIASNTETAAFPARSLSAERAAHHDATVIAVALVAFLANVDGHTVIVAKGLAAAATLL